MADVFTKETKRIIEDRAGNKCSNPDCRAQTNGPNAHPERSTKTGVTAHITAASPGGPRFDPGMIPEQRKSAENGIWLCQNCAHFIDTDYLKYPVELLRNWKNKAELEAEIENKRIKSPVIQEEGWECPFCGTGVELGKFVCLGCQAEVVPGLTREERVERGKTGMTAGFGLSTLLLLLIPSWILSELGIKVSFSGGGYIISFLIISAVMSVVGGRVFIYFAEKKALANAPRFFRTSIR
ncbi:hypothetical protein [Klebsiella oxytoca]|uniref:hypothetical protein n=1 Tax=Klebsiella oxytoca TaxID=571 RepID=UPI001BD5348D|nr:hypothetical protein [Klebsiella oxytoca]